MDRQRRTAFVAIVALLVALIGYTYSMRFRAVEAPSAPALDRVPVVCGDYRGNDETLDAETLELLGADETLFRTYRSPGEETVWLFLAYFASPQENSQIHSPKHCYPGAGWTILEEGTTPIGIGGATIPVKHLVISDDAERHFVLYWFSSADEIITDEFALKWHQMSASLFGRPRSTAFIRLSTAIGEREAVSEAERRLARFAGALDPGLEPVLRSGDAAPPAVGAPADSTSTGAAAR